MNTSEHELVGSFASVSCLPKLYTYSKALEVDQWKL